MTHEKVEKQGRDDHYELYPTKQPYIPCGWPEQQYNTYIFISMVLMSLCTITHTCFSSDLYYNLLASYIIRIQLAQSAIYRPKVTLTVVSPEHFALETCYLLHKTAQSNLYQNTAHIGQLIRSVKVILNFYHTYLHGNCRPPVPTIDQ